MYPTTLQPSVHHSFSPPLFSFFGTASQQQQLLQQQQQSAQLAPFQPQLPPLTSTLTRQEQPQSPQQPQQQQQQRQPQPQPQPVSKIHELLSPPVSPTRQVPYKKQLSLKYQSASAGSSMTVVIPSPPAVESVVPASATRQPDTIEEEEAMVALQNISKQKTPPPAPIAIPVSASPSPASPTGDSSRSAFSVVSSPNRSAASGVPGLVSVGASPSPPKLLEKSPGTPVPKPQRRLPTPKKLAYESPSDEPSELVIDQEDEESESEERPTNKRHGRKKAERGAPAKRRNSKTFLQEEAAFFSKKRKRDEDDDYEFDEDDEDDSDEEFQADDSEDSDREFHIRTQKKSHTRRRIKVVEGEEAGSPEPVTSSPSKKGTNRGTQLGYLHNLGPELRSYLAAWLSRHTTVETGSPNSDPLYRCVKCTPPAGEQTKVSSSDRHKPGRVRIAIPQHLRKAHLPEKILAYHASSALFGQLPTASDLNNGLVASHRCGHSWCVAAHHLVWEPLGAKLARERGKQCCPGGDACRHGPLRCFKR